MSTPALFPPVTVKWTIPSFDMADQSMCYVDIDGMVTMGPLQLVIHVVQNRLNCRIPCHFKAAPKDRWMHGYSDTMYRRIHKVNMFSIIVSAYLHICISAYPLWYTIENQPGLKTFNLNLILTCNIKFTIHMFTNKRSNGYASFLL